MKKARVNRAQYHNRQLLNRQPLTRSKFFFVLFAWSVPFPRSDALLLQNHSARCGFALAGAMAELDRTTHRWTNEQRADSGDPQAV